MQCCKQVLNTYETPRLRLFTSDIEHHHFQSLGVKLLGFNKAILHTQFMTKFPEVVALLPIPKMRSRMIRNW